MYRKIPIKVGVNEEPASSTSAAMEKEKALPAEEPLDIQQSQRAYSPALAASAAAALLAGATLLAAAGAEPDAAGALSSSSDGG